MRAKSCGSSSTARSTTSGNSAEQYTAEVLLQREAQRSPLDAFTVRLGPGVPTEAVLSQLEILRSRAVLAAAVDSLALRVSVDDRGVRWSEVLVGVEVSPDARRPGAHPVFGLDPTPGLSDVLVGEAAATDAIRGELGEPGLSLLPCGTSVPHPTELLGGQAFAGVLDYARHNFDAVVIDTPPILAAADAAVIGSAVDGVVVVAKANETDRTALARAADHMRQVKASLLALVLNEVPLTGPYKRYGYYCYLWRRLGQEERGSATDSEEPSQRVRVGRSQKRAVVIVAITR